MRHLGDHSTAKRMQLFRNATLITCFLAGAACTSMTHEEYAAYGYLSPGPSGEPELIGVFDSVDDCEAAGEDWASRQVVGNPVFTECLPVGRD